MHLTVIPTLVLMVVQCLAGGIIKTWKQHEYSSLIQATADLLKSCYATQVDAVGLAGDSDAFLIKTLHSSTSIPVTLLDGTRRVVGHDPVQREHRHKLQVTVVTASSSPELEKTLLSMKDSLWWNHMASILILAWQPQSGCSTAFSMLSAAWKIDLLNAKLMCLGPTEERLIYTYNPYTRMAPDGWQVENTYRGQNDHPWTLLVRRYLEADEICQELDYDKAQDLAGYEIRCTVMNHPGPLTIDVNKTGLDRFGGGGGAISKVFFHALNGNPKLLVYNTTNALGFSDDKGRDILMDTVEGISDIHLNDRYVVVKEDITITYPHFYSGLSVVTQYRGHMSQLTKILSVVDSSSRRGICLMILINVFVFIFVLRQKPGPAMLNTLRLVCNGGIPMVPMRLAPRLYMGTLFLFVVTVQAIYQGKLAALLTKPVLLPNVDTMQDLVEGGYTVYAYKSVERFFRPPIFEGSFVAMKHFNCIELVLSDPRAACVSEYIWMIEQAATLGLHLSREPIIKLPVTYVIRDNWPLESRVNKVLGSMVEADIIHYVFMKRFDRFFNVLQSYEKQEEDQQFNAITLGEVTFAFVILGIGLGFAAICFIVEMQIQSVKWISIHGHF